MQENTKMSKRRWMLRTFERYESYDEEIKLFTVGTVSIHGEFNHFCHYIPMIHNAHVAVDRRTAFCESRDTIAKGNTIEGLEYGEPRDVSTHASSDVGEIVDARMAVPVPSNMQTSPSRTQGMKSVTAASKNTIFFVCSTRKITVRVWRCDTRRNIPPLISALKVGVEVRIAWVSIPRIHRQKNGVPECLHEKIPDNLRAITYQ
ncbi:hypothetical protein C8R43DRAFT_961544 [Mycena crocata]|nr:hypothetical protein C8R43DRAFT_961544 [Mycena crocata]